MLSRRHLLLCGLLLAAALLLLVKPAVVRTDRDSRLLVLLRWQSGEIRFTNSVTGGPVAIHFRITGQFQDFAVTTNEATEAYYTSGLYSMNEALSTNATQTLRFCSIKGIHLTLGFYHFDVKNGCLEVKLLWTM